MLLLLFLLSTLIHTFTFFSFFLNIVHVWLSLAIHYSCCNFSLVISGSQYMYFMSARDQIQVVTPAAAAAAAKSLQSCPTLCDPIDGSPPGFPVPGILQARTLEWVAISFSNAWKWKVKVKSLSRIRLLATPWTAAYQAPPSMGYSRQEYWSGVPFPSPSHPYFLNFLLPCF